MSNVKSNSSNSSGRIGNRLRKKSPQNWRVRDVPGVKTGNSVRGENAPQIGLEAKYESSENKFTSDLITTENKQKWSAGEEHQEDIAQTFGKKKRPFLLPYELPTITVRGKLLDKNAVYLTHRPANYGFLPPEKLKVNPHPVLANLRQAYEYWLLTRLQRSGVQKVWAIGISPRRLQKYYASGDVPDVHVNVPRDLLFPVVVEGRCDCAYLACEHMDGCSATIIEDLHYVVDKNMLFDLIVQRRLHPVYCLVTVPKGATGHIFNEVFYEPKIVDGSFFHKVTVDDNSYTHLEDTCWWFHGSKKHGDYIISWSLECGTWDFGWVSFRVTTVTEMGEKLNVDRFVVDTSFDTDSVGYGRCRFSAATFEGLDFVLRNVNHVGAVAEWFRFGSEYVALNRINDQETLVLAHNRLISEASSFWVNKPITAANLSLCMTRVNTKALSLDILDQYRSVYVLYSSIIGAVIDLPHRAQALSIINRASDEIDLINRWNNLDFSVWWHKWLRRVCMALGLADFVMEGLVAVSYFWRLHAWKIKFKSADSYPELLEWLSQEPRYRLLAPKISLFLTICNVFVWWGTSKYNVWLQHPIRLFNLTGISRPSQGPIDRLGINSVNAPGAPNYAGVPQRRPL